MIHFRPHEAYTALFIIALIIIFTGYGLDLKFLRPQCNMTELQYSFSGYIYTGRNIPCLFGNGPQWV